MSRNREDLAAGHRVCYVEPGSIADELGIRPGDRVLSLDQREITDAFDFYLWQLAEHLILTVADAQGEVTEYEIEKEADEPLGLDFTQDMLDDCRSCHNRCLFCFIDQLPEGMRSTLYFKDDDLRMSFLSGNYVTLTNISDSELDRLIRHRLSPINISVHTTDKLLRRRMMGNREAGRILERMQKIASAGLSMNAQIVLCPGINDGSQLEQTLADLAGLGPCLNSVAIVPVGLTRYRSENRLYPLTAVGKKHAETVLALIGRWQKRMLAERGTRLVFAADEFYLLAGQNLPEPAAYEDFPQLENGVGMAVQMVSRIQQDLQEVSVKAAAPSYQAWPDGRAGQFTADPPPALIMVTGQSFAGLLRPLAKLIGHRFDLNTVVAAIENVFFGPSITVTGLLTGQDLLAQLPETIREVSGRQAACILLPANMLRAGSQVLLDDVTVQQLADQLGVPILVCAADGSDLVAIVSTLAGRKGRDCDE